MKIHKIMMWAGLFLLWTFTQAANAQGLKFRVVSFGEDPFDLAARSEDYKEVDGSGSLYAIIKVSSETPDDDVNAYQYNFGMMNHKVKQHNGEVWVYVQKNAKTVTLSRQGYQTISRYDLGTTIEAGKTYKMILSAQAASVQHCILQFSVDPPGENAIVKVKREGDDGDYDLWGTVDATGGLAKRLEVGTYLYEIVAEHYDRTEGRIPLNGSESKHVERVTLTPNFGYLVVDDANGITGADVYVNDRKIGTVPYTSKERWDVRDDYRIMVSKGDKYKTYSSTFAIRKGETTKIVPTLEADFAQTTLQVANNAEIWIEDVKKGTGTWSGPLRAGIYNVECRLDRHRTTRRAITVTANKSETFTLDAPTPITGSIYINSNPLGATIKLDGKEYGTTPNEIQNVLVGTHTLILNYSGYNEEKKDVEVREGETAEVEVTMSDKPIFPDEKTFTVNGVSFVMKHVEGGTFLMGATSEQGSDAWDDEKPVHSVTLSNYYIGETEVTQALWQAVMGNNPSNFKYSSFPVESVSWQDCQEFVRKLNAQTGQKFRLPTEAEWEYAARGGKKSRGYKYSGSNTLGNVAWWGENSNNSTHPVKTKQANELGLYDMSGNVWEWCQDWYGSYVSSNQTNPVGPKSGSDRMWRGGSWRITPRLCRVSNRFSQIPISSELGLRLALNYADITGSTTSSTETQVKTQYGKSNTGITPHAFVGSRRAIYLATPKLPTSLSYSACTVVVSIIVNSAGKVTTAFIQSSTTDSSTVHFAAVSAAKASIFSAGTDYAERGTITYYF